MKISFNPKLHINSSVKQNKIPFKGSFNVPLDAFVPQEPKEKNSLKDEIKTKNITRTFKLDTNADKSTFVRMWTMPEEDSKEQIPQLVLQSLEGLNVDPFEDIFMTGGYTKDNRYFVIFNSYYFDKETNKNNVQYNCLVSKDNTPTKLQKAIMTYFNDSTTKDMFKKGSKENPFERLGNFEECDKKHYEIITLGLGAISKETDFEDMIKPDGAPSSVIYTGDGKYPKFKVVKMDLANF